MSGWIKLHRKLQSNPLWESEAFSKGQAWIDLLMTANHKPSFFMLRGNKIDVGIGDVARSKEELAKRWKWSRGKVLRFLALLEKEGQITRKTVHNFSLVTICNYKEYQTGDTTDSTTNGTADSTTNDTTVGTADSTTNGTHTRITNNNKEGKEGEECKEVKASPKKQKFVPPLWMPPERWADYLESRKEKKHPMSAGSLELCCKAIEKTQQAGYGLDDILDKMIESGWRTVKPDFMQNSQQSGFNSRGAKPQVDPQETARLIGANLFGETVQ